MKKILLRLIVVAFIAGGTAAYLQLGGSPEDRRDRFLNKAREYGKRGKFNESLIELKNAVKADPSSADAHYEFALALLKRGDYRSASQEQSELQI